MHLEKRGQYANIEIWFLLIAILLAAVVGIDLLKDTKEKIDGTLLEKNYIARDLAMTIEAIYASPGDIEYNYRLRGYSNKFLVELKNGNVIVKKVEENRKEGPVSYRIIGSDKVELPNFKIIRIIDETKPIKLIFSKKFDEDGSAIISVKADNAVGEP